MSSTYMRFRYCVLLPKVLEEEEEKTLLPHFRITTRLWSYDVARQQSAGIVTLPGTETY